jgi:hypothetical protein
MRYFEYTVVSIVEGTWDNFPRVSVFLPTPNPSQEGNIAEECILIAQVENFSQVVPKDCIPALST